MNAKDQAKVLEAGFMIIRERDTGIKSQEHAIAAKTKERKNWFIWRKGCKSKAARRRAMSYLLESEKAVED